jgi:hypothetical protein
MFVRSGVLLSTAAAAAAFQIGSSKALATPQVGDVFVIAMENHNWTQPLTDTSAPQQIFGNTNAPFINSLVTPGNPNAAQVSYASDYHNVLATPSGNNPSIHPSEPNYIWEDAGSNLGTTNDNDPYNGPNVTNYPHLTGLLQASGQSWKSYQEDTDVTTSNQPLAPGQYTVPLASKSGNWTGGATNAYNGSTQFNYAAKHNPQVFFNDTNGSGDATTANPKAANYAPMQQLQTDLTNNTVGKYNFISPNQYNDQHTALSSGFTYKGVHLTGDSSQIAVGDNFLSIVVPEIEASAAYQNNGAIVIWNDETEGANANDFTHTSMFIVISPLAKGNAFNDPTNYTHSSDVRTFQEIFDVGGPNGGFLQDAANATDESNMFVSGAIPNGVNTSFVPEPGALSLLGIGGWLATRRRRRHA